MRITTFVSISTLLVLIAAHAQAKELDGASCTADISAAEQTFETIMAARPKTVTDPHSSVALCDAPPRLAINPNVRTAELSVSIPLASLSHAPLSLDEFTGEIRSVEMPEPWSADGTSTFTIANGNLNVKATVNPAMWSQVPGQVWITLASGQRLQVEMPSSKLVVDETAYNKDAAAGNLAAKKSMLDFYTSSLAEVKAQIADPSSIPFNSEAARTGAKVALAAHEAAIANARPALEARWAAASTQERALTWSGMEMYLPANLRAELEPLSQEAINASNAVNSARGPVSDFENIVAQAQALREPARSTVLAQYQPRLDAARAALAAREAGFAATKAKLDAFVSKNGLGDALLASMQQRLSNSDTFRADLQGRENERALLAHLDEMEARNREQTLARLRASVPEIESSIARTKADIARYEAELADTTPITREIPTAYSSSCPAPIATR